MGFNFGLYMEKIPFGPQLFIPNFPLIDKPQFFGFPS